MSNIIQLDIHKKSFLKKDFSILNDFHLKVKHGETLAIMGESGIGKTTLLNIIGLLDKQYEGDYQIFGSSIENISDDQQAIWRNQKIGFVLQESALIDSLTIEDNIKLPLIYANLEKDAVVQRQFKDIVHKLDIASILQNKPKECSGGQKSRAVFARGIIMNPKILLSDEPTASLDEKSKNKILNLLFEMNKEFNTTLITVTHDFKVSEYHDRVITLERG